MLADIDGLPLADEAWQLDIVPGGPQVDGLDLDGYLFVVGADTGTPRLVVPLVQGTTIDLRAACRPEIPNIADERPREILVRRPELVRRIRDLLGARLRTVAELPMVDALSNMFFGAFGEAEFPLHGSQHLTRAWGALMTTRPWRSVHDDVVFRFPEANGPLAKACAVVIGALGEQRGIVLFRTEGDLARFMEAADDFPPVMDGICAWSLHADSLDELPESVAMEAAALGLVSEDGLAPLLTDMRDGRLAAMEAADQQLVSLAVQAICGLVYHHGHPVDDGLVHRARIEVSTGAALLVEACVEDLLDDGSPLAIDVDHQIVIGHFRLDGERVDGLVFKAAKADAERAVRHFHRADQVTFEVEGPMVGVRLFAGADDLGLLCVTHIAEMGPVRGLPTVAVGISAGGARRRSFRGKDLLWMQSLEVR